MFLLRFLSIKILKNLKYIANYVLIKPIFIPFIKKITYQKPYSQKCLKNKDNFQNNLLLFFISIINYENESNIGSKKKFITKCKNV